MMGWSVGLLLGIGLGLSLLLYVFDSPTPGAEVLAGLFWFLGAAVCGTMLGFAQWLVLRVQVALSCWWVPASTVSMAAGCGLGWLLWAKNGNLYGSATVGVGVGGALLGIAQGRLLGVREAHINWWILANVAGVVGGCLVGCLTGALAAKQFVAKGLQNLDFQIFVMGIVSIAVSGTIVAVITGNVLIWLLAKNRLT